MSRERSRNTSLKRLFPHAGFVACEDICVTAVGCDSRSIEPGAAFVALRGAQTDGHGFIAEAIARGATAVVTEAAVPGLAVPQCVLADAREAYGVLCQELAGNPAARLRVVAVTGTNGKTTTSILIQSVLEAAGYRTGLVGTIQQFDGNTSFPATLTTPAADVLARIMRRMVEAGCTHAVMEVSSHALDQRRVAGIPFAASVFTNLTHDHLDYHRDFAEYRAAKGRLFRGLATEATALLNADDPASKHYASICQAGVVTYGLSAVADITASSVELAPAGTRFIATASDGRCAIRTALLGAHNVSNCLAAAAVGRCLGFDWETVRVGIERVHEVPGRLQPVRCGQPFQVLVDYAHTPDAITSALRTVRAITSGRVICVFGAGGDRDRTKRPAMAQAAELGADLIVVTSDNPRTEDPKRIIHDIVSGFTRAGAVIMQPDRRAAIEFALAAARPGDCVLIAGKGHESYQIIGERRLPFDDRVVAAEWLARRSGATVPGIEFGTGKRQSELPRQTA